MIHLGVRLPPELDKRLSRLSKKTSRSKSYYVKEALQGYLDDMEDIYLAEKRKADLKAGKERLWTQEEIEAGLDLED